MLPSQPFSFFFLNFEAPTSLSFRGEFATVLAVLFLHLSLSGLAKQKKTTTCHLPPPTWSAESWTSPGAREVAASDPPQLPGSGSRPNPFSACRRRPAVSEAMAWDLQLYIGGAEGKWNETHFNPCHSFPIKLLKRTPIAWHPRSRTMIKFPSGLRPTLPFLALSKFQDLPIVNPSSCQISKWRQVYSTFQRSNFIQRDSRDFRL